MNYAITRKQQIFSYFYMTFYSKLHIVILLCISISMLHHTLRRVIFSFVQLYPKDPDLATTQSTFYANKLRFQPRKQKLTLPDFHKGDLSFGKLHTDHMITIDYDIHTGWANPVLQPFGNLKIHPFSSSLHYGVQCYQGTKAYKNQKGEVRLFRVDHNALRLKRSSVRLTLPDFDGQQLVDLIIHFVREEERWIPPISQYSLYVRPFHFGISEALGVHSPQKSKLAIAASPVSGYYSSGFKPISVYCQTQSARCAPKGTGYFKLGGNYGPTILTASKAQALGHSQVLWLHQDNILQVGSSNIFFIFRDSSGVIEIATPELEDLVLPGITRDSILTLLREKKQYRVSQRTIHIGEVIQRHQRGQLLECFGSGTAVVVSGVSNIHYRGKNYAIPVNPAFNSGPISQQIRTNLLDIQEGRAQDNHGWVTRIK